MEILKRLDKIEARLATIEARVSMTESKLRDVTKKLGLFRTYFGQNDDGLQ